MNDDNPFGAFLVKLRAAELQFQKQVASERNQLKENIAADIAAVERKKSVETASLKTQLANELSASSLQIRDLFDDDHREDRTENIPALLTLGSLTLTRRNSGVNEDVQVPWVIPLFGQGHIFFEQALDNEGNVELQSIVASCLAQSDPGQVEVTFFDPQLTGIASPFVQLNDSQGDTIRVLNQSEKLKAALIEASDEITSIDGKIANSKLSLTEFRAKVGFPVGKFRLFVISDIEDLHSEEEKAELAKLIQVGARLGLSFVIRTWSEISSSNLRAKISQAVKYSTIRASPRETTWQEFTNLEARFEAETEMALLNSIDSISKQWSNFTPPSIDFEEVEDVGVSWSRNSAKGISFALGKSGSRVTEITLGDSLQQRHNILVTGAVGQGKSNLLKVMIHSLANRYSPNELEMYLLDFKEGVTLYPLSPKANPDSFLPHATVMGLESDREFGLAVLEHLDEEFSKRAKLFKPFGDNIESYRDKAGPEAVMPRIVVVIDEFHLLFDPNDDTASESARLLERVARLGRAYGIHLILASQTISGIAALMSRDSGLFSQFPIRIALKNSLAESHATLSQQNDGAARLQIRGQAVLNLNYGLLEDNQICLVAVAAEPKLNELRRGWCRQPGLEGLKPRIFDGTRRVPFREVVPRLEALRTQESGRASHKTLFLGEPIRVESNPHPIPMPNDPGRNIAVIGSGSKPGRNSEISDNDLAIGAMQNIGLTLAFQYPKDKVKFIVLDCLDEKLAVANGQHLWQRAMERKGFDLEIFTRGQISEGLASIKRQVDNARTSEVETWVLGFALDRAQAMNRSVDYEDSPAEVLRQILEDGPSVGVHLAGSWGNFELLEKQIGLSLHEVFQVALFLGANTDSVKNFFGYGVTWAISENRGLVGDTSHMTSPELVIPYSPFTQEDLNYLEAQVWNA